MFLRSRLTGSVDLSVSCFSSMGLSWLVDVSNVDGNMQKPAKPAIPAVTLDMGLILPALIYRYGVFVNKSVNFDFNRNLMLLLLLMKTWVLQREVLS